MFTIIRHYFLIAACVLPSLAAVSLQAEDREQLNRGALVLCGGGLADGVGDRIGQFLLGGGAQNPIHKRFVELAGGPGAEFVIIHAPNSHAPQDKRPLAERVAGESDTQSAVAFGVDKMTALRFTDRDAADSENFVAPLRKANGVWITGGDVNVLVRAGKDTRFHRELEGVLARGGVIGGESAGAVIQTAQISRNIKGVAPGGTPDTTLFEGYGFIKDLVVVPHLFRMGWQESLVPVIETHPTLLGLGIDEGTAVVIQNGVFEVIGNNKVAVYDNVDHGGRRYYLLSAGDQFDLATRSAKTKSGKGR